MKIEAFDLSGARANGPETAAIVAALEALGVYEQAHAAPEVSSKWRRAARDYDQGDLRTLRRSRR